MIGIIYSFVLFFGVIQLLFFLILAIPMPKGYKKSLSNFLDGPTGQKISQWEKYALFIVGLLFFNSIRDIDSYIDTDLHPMTHMEKLEFHVKRLYNERNFYLTGFSLILTLAIVAYLFEIKKYYSIKYPFEEELKSKNIDLDAIIKGKINLQDALQQGKSAKQVTKSHIHGLNKLKQYNQPYCQLCKSKVETTPQKIKLSEKNDTILNTCSSCKLLTTYSKEQLYILHELDNYEENSLYYKVVQKYENNHSKTEITDRLVILSELVYYEKPLEVQKNMEKDEKIKLHFDNLKILKQNKYALMAVDNVKMHCYFAFRGTKLDVSDFLNDIDIAITGDATSRIKDMDDFYDLNKKDWVQKKYNIFLTGHSLGGNVAEYMLMQNDEVTQCETFNAGNSFDFFPDFLDHLFQNENETTLQQLQKGKNEGKSQKQIANSLSISVDQLKKRIQKAKNSDQNIQKDREQKIIQHIIKGDPISLSKIYPYSQRFEVMTDKILFGAHSLSNFIKLIDYPIKKN